MTTPIPAAPPILETAIYTGDLEAAEWFYGTVMGLEKVLAKPGRHVFFRVPGGILLVFRPDATEVAEEPGPLAVPPHGARGPGHVCFAADAEALERWRARLAAHGIEIEAEVDWPNGARSIYVRDPAGNSVEFAEPRLWA